MRADRVLRLHVFSRDLLDWLMAEPLPSGFREAGTGIEAFRILFYDTVDRDLERRGIAVNLCIRQDGSRILRVDVRERETPGGAARHRYVEADVGPIAGPDLFTGPSDAARLVRAVVDPDRLAVALELETVRRIRSIAASDHAEPRARIAYDIVTARRDGLVGELYEVEIRVDEAEAKPFEGLMQAFEEGYRLRPVLGDVVARARELLSSLQSAELALRLRAARHVAVVPYDGGRIALCRSGGEGLRVPTGPGAGGDACRRVLRGWLGQVRGRVRVLGTCAATSQRPAFEVWLVEDIDPAATDGERFVWLALEDALALAGSARLRDAPTLAALELIARSDLPTRAAARAAAPPPAPRTADAEPLEIVAADPDDADPDPPSAEPAPGLLLNHELSRLAFDERILVMAENRDVPLLERIRYMALFGSRQDDFFMTRVAEFKEQIAAAVTRRTPDGLTAGEQLDVIRIRARQIAGRAYGLLLGTLIPELGANDLRILRWADLDDDQRAHLRDHYWNQVEAMITPLVADQSHPFPHIRNLRPAIAAIVRLAGSRVERFVAIELPGSLPRFVPLSTGRGYVPIEEVILGGLSKLYPGVEVVRAHTFRVTRSATSRKPAADAANVMAALEEELAERPFRHVVRLEVEQDMPADVRRHLLRELRFETPESVSTLGEADIYAVPWLVDLAGLAEIAAVDMPHLRYPPLDRTSPLEPDRSIFEQIRERERLVCFPDHAFDATVQRLLVEAAEDPHVLAIKITLYRTDPDSEIVRALARARAAGKNAFALVELKASFDERRNIAWARSLEAAGVHVVFSPQRYKVHAKIALVVRREPDGVRRYAFVGTGNLNATTAATYTDVGLLTASPELGEEVNALFNVLTGYCATAEFERLLVSPFQMRRRFIELIEREVRHARDGRGGHIRAQLNGLSDGDLIAALYSASRAGVRIELAVRELCSIRPGIPGVSENIRVVSVLGRLLQHSRILYFGNGGSAEYYIGSADWRPRNLLRRVEVVTPVLDPEHQAQLNRTLRALLEHPEAWELRSDGAYVRGSQVIGAMRPPKRAATWQARPAAPVDGAHYDAP